ncbi:substrate-binding periplasmic protein [Bdellovibrio sp. HCB209]|uniref:substrate-binding periplasmic protein n=1 Tax=Bdellovibrio sp. HCB209 TaxID=3394354 RepID=UPI0039B4474B
MKYWAGLFFYATMFCGGAHAQAEVLRIGAIDSPPHVTDAQSNPPKGEFIAFLQKYILPPVIKKHKVKVEWHSAPLKRQFRDLEVGNLDVLLMVLRNPEREKVYNYSEDPVIADQPGMIVPKNLFKNRDSVSIKEFSGKNVGLVAGAFVPEYFQQNKINTVVIAGEDAGERIPNLVETKRIDAAFIYLNSITEGVVRNSKIPSIKSVTVTDVPPYSMYLAYNKKVSAKVRNEIDTQLRLYLKEYKFK